MATVVFFIPEMWMNPSSQVLFVSWSELIGKLVAVTSEFSTSMIAPSKPNFVYGVG